MADTNVEVLNDVTKTLIDSRKGYEKMIEVTDDNYMLKAEFQGRLAQRDGLIQEFQQKVRTFGGEPEDSGSVAGAVHRGYAEFTSLFMDDEKAALEAVDDGEEHLAEKIESKLDDGVVHPEVRDLLQRAHASAKSGERFADRLTN